MGEMSPTERLNAIEALSAAAWLHDVGQQGGVLDDIYVRDYSHVRKYHGVLTCEAVEGDDGAEEFGLGDPDLRFLVAQLSKCHQRIARLHMEEVKDPKYCKQEDACPECKQVETRLSASLAGELNRVGNPLLRNPFAVSIAAILRIADAADIGVHRVNGRWIAGTTAVERAWRREFVYETLNRYCQLLLKHEPELANDDLGDALRAVYRLLMRKRWSQADLNTMEASLASCGTSGSDLATELLAFDEHLAEQREHVDKHELFAGSRIKKEEGNTFSITLRAAAGWRRAGADERRKRFKLAYDYIWHEYLHSEEFFQEPVLPRLAWVESPDGKRVEREEIVT
jgi:hypothetical protein